MKALLEKYKRLLVYGDQALVSGVNFLIGIILARLMGLEVYGQFVLLWMVVLFVSSIHQAFIIMPLYSLYAQQEKQEKYIRNVVFLQYGFATLSFFVISLGAIIYSYFDEGFSFYTALLLGLSSSCFVMGDFSRRLFFLFQLPFKSLLVDLITYGCLPISVIILNYADFLTLDTLLLSISVLNLVGSFLGLKIFYRNGFAKNGSRQTFLSNWQFSKYLIGTGILQWFSGNFFLFLSGAILGASATGALRIAQNVMGVLHVIFLAMENSVPIRAAQILHQKGKKATILYFKKIMQKSSAPILLILGLIVVFSKEILVFLYGAEYEEYTWVLICYSVIYIFIFIGTILRFIIRTFEQNRIIFNSYVFSSMLSVLTANLMISNFGMMGVVMGLIMVQIFTISVYVFFLKIHLQ